MSAHVQVPSDIDLRIMLTFLDFYQTLVGFVNYKLYADENLAYPPVLDEAKDGGAAGLAALTVQSRSTLGAAAATASATAAPATGQVRGGPRARRPTASLTATTRMGTAREGRDTPGRSAAQVAPCQDRKTGRRRRRGQ